MPDPTHDHRPPHGLPLPAEPPQGGADPLSREVYAGLHTAMKLHKRLMLKLLAGGEIHPAQAMCLGMLSRRDGMSQSELAEALHVSRPTVTTMLQRLESSGVIERRDDESDQRVTRVYLTAEGSRVAQAMHEVHGTLIDTAVGWMSEADRTEFLRLLTAMNSHLLEATDDAPCCGHHSGPADQTDDEVRP